MAVKKRIIIKPISITHVEDKWISERIGGHGGSYTWNFNKPDGLVRIRYIGSTPKIVVWYYNLQLFMRFCRRKIWRVYLNCMGVKY